MHTQLIIIIIFQFFGSIKMVAVHLRTVQKLTCLPLNNTYVSVITPNFLKHEEFENVRKVAILTLDENLSHKGWNSLQSA